MTIDETKSYSATFKTNHGDINIDLFPSQAPVTVNNFVFLARAGFYNDVIFHRVIPSIIKGARYLPIAYLKNFGFKMQSG